VVQRFVRIPLFTQLPVFIVGAVEGTLSKPLAVERRAVLLAAAGRDQDIVAIDVRRAGTRDLERSLIVYDGRHGGNARLSAKSRVKQAGEGCKRASERRRSRRGRRRRTCSAAISGAMYSTVPTYENARSLSV